METIAECVGGGADGVKMDPPDPEEPDDWPDFIEVTNKHTGTADTYYLVEFKPIIRDGFRIYLYIHDSLIDTEGD